MEKVANAYIGPRMSKKIRCKDACRRNTQKYIQKKRVRESLASGQRRESYFYVYLVNDDSIKTKCNRSNSGCLNILCY
jgi:hypothetical protein